MLKAWCPYWEMRALCRDCWRRVSVMQAGIQQTQRGGSRQMLDPSQAPWGRCGFSLSTAFQGGFPGCHSLGSSRRLHCSDLYSSCTAFFWVVTIVGIWDRAGRHVCGLCRGRGRAPMNELLGTEMKESWDYSVVLSALLANVLLTDVNFRAPRRSARGRA